MGERTTIEWCHHTLNPFWGCTKVSPGCDNCYAESWAKRFGVLWGAGQPRRLASERTWSEPYRWNAKAERDGVRRRVFCASMADVFDNEAPEGARERLWKVIEDNTSLDWLLLTKRVGNVISMVPKNWQKALPSHVWMGATIVNQEEADRDIPKLLRVPAAVRFLSCEPLLDRIYLDMVRAPTWALTQHMNVLTGEHNPSLTGMAPEATIDWVIAGAESGHKARLCDLDWIRSVRDQCESAKVPFFFKQYVHDGIKTSTPLLDGRRWVEVPKAGESLPC